MPRLLICKKCQTIEEMPLAPDLPAGEVDPLLANVWGRHGHAQIVIGGPDPEVQLLAVKNEDWSNQRIKDEILRELGQKWVGFHPEFYATKNTYQEDALHCFSRHSRPKDGCIDWKDSSKRLTPQDWTKAHVYLCDFCPVASTVTTKIRMARGDYDRQPGEVD